ncbi:MAG: 50S ribosomal protein L25/general stress protein Ctc [Bacteroidota bacterium]|jgi:large subunit ribosomal protein L25|nr:50S ribosomal protein L25/general stress protein Ctc [Bacteroidota bacterium]
MEKVEIIGYNRANLGKKEAKRLRSESYVPCVIYGGKEQIHFFAPMILFKNLVYTPDAHMVDLNIEGDKYECILQDIQFHPVNEVILHADFLQLFKDKPVKMEIPVKLEGTAVGVSKGGKLFQKLRSLTIKSLPDDMPDSIKVNVSKLALGKSIKVGDLPGKKIEILNSPLVTIASVETPRALRGVGGVDDEEEEAPSEVEATEVSENKE